LQGVVGSNFVATLRRIDANNTNPIQTWFDLGEPEYPSNKEISAMYQASEMILSSIDYNSDGDSEISFTVDLPVQGVAAITFPTNPSKHNDH